MPEEVGGIVGTISVAPDDDLQSQLGKLKAALDQVEGELNELHTKFGQTGQAASITGLRIGDLAAEKLKLKAEIDKVTASLGTNAAAHSRAAAAAAQGVGASKQFSYQLMALGSTLDDLQYVGEMGLRPIINNLMMLSPALGIALIAFDQIRKHSEELISALRGVNAVFGDFLGQGTQSLFEGMISNFEKVGKAAKRLVDDIKGAWGELSGSNQKAAEDMVAEFAKVGANDEANKKKGKAYSEAVTEKYGRGNLLGRFVSPELAENNPELAQREAARIAGMMNRVAAGSPEAIKELEGMAAHDPALRGVLHEADPQTKENAKREDALRKEADKRKKAADRRDREMQEADEKANRLLRKRRDDSIEKKIERGEPLTGEEMMGMNDPLREKLAGKVTKDAEKRATLQERYSDVAMRLYQERNPAREGQSLGMDQFESSVKSTTGLTEGEKQLIRIRELQEDLVRIQSEYKTIGVKARGGGR
jgi:hypothetical protein